MSRLLVCSVTLALGLGAACSASAALVGYYPLNGNANEATGNNIDLNLLGNAGFGASGHAGLGRSLSLDGDGDAAIGENFVKFDTDSASVVAWVYAESLEGDWNSIIKSWGQTVGGQFHFGLGNAAGYGRARTPGSPFLTPSTYAPLADPTDRGGLPVNPYVGPDRLPRGQVYYGGRFFGSFNNRFYGPQYGYF